MLSVSPLNGDLKSDADRAIQASHEPSGVIVDEQLEILQFRGDTRWCLDRPAGSPTNNLLKLCREGMLKELRSSLKKASASDLPVTCDAWIKAVSLDTVAITIEVIPFTSTRAKRKCFVVLFSPRIAWKEFATGSTEAQLRIERDLAETKDYLNAIIEKGQTTNEQLKAANEEILTANEELLSSNEEIAAAKEETQTVNEKLLIVNGELEKRNRDLDRVSSDLTTLFGSIQIPIVMLSEDLAIKHFTSAAERVLGLTSEDRGASLTNIAERLPIRDLARLSREVLESLDTKDIEVQDREGRWFSLRITPSRSPENRIDGVVIALVDIDSLKVSFRRLEQAHDYAEAIVQTAPVPLLVLDSNLRVLTANQAFYRHFRVAQAETVNALIYDLGNGQWNVPLLRKLLEDILPKNELMENYLIEHEFPRLGRRSMRLNARRLIQHDGRDARILLAINDLTAERLAEEKMTAAKIAAEFANKAKSDFLANMSHEIRTPLGAILGYTELLADPDQPEAGAVHCVTRIRKNIEQLSELIDEILDIAKIEAGKFEVDFVPFALVPELAETFALLQDRAEAKGLSFDLNFEGELPEVVTSCARRMRQILLNIVGNALKFTEVGGISVAVALQRQDPAAVKLSFVISDTGCGLTPEQSARLFRPFSQADSSVTRRFGGTGLGLTLARRLAEALGGDVVLTESEFGKGTTFTITIGVGTLDGAVMVKGLSKSVLARRKPEIKDWFTISKRLDDVRVLLVEDGPDNKALMTHFLTESGAEVTSAVNGLEAVAMGLDEVFDIILMDIQMPLLDGYEATKRLREANCSTPIVALTAHAMRGEREKCLAAGCIDYVSKPVKPSVLIATVERYTKNIAVGAKAALSERSSLADDPVVGPLVPLFLKSLPSRMAALHDAERRLSWPEVATLAHQMAGAAGGYGFLELGRVAARIERDATHEPSRKQLQPSFKAFDALCKKALKGEGSPLH